MNDQIKSMLDESINLHNLIINLSTAVYKPEFNHLPFEDQADMNDQLHHMRQYYKILDRRLTRALNAYNHAYDTKDSEGSL